MSIVEALLSTVFWCFYYGIFICLLSESQEMWHYCINKSARVAGRVLFLLSISMMIFPVVYMMSNY